MDQSSKGNSLEQRREERRKIRREQRRKVRQKQRLSKTLNVLDDDTSIKDIAIPQWKMDIINDIKEKLQNGYKLVFIHIPKCGGMYARQYIDNGTMDIKNNKHTIVKNENEITFAIIRDPVKRFESFLNFHLSTIHKILDFYPPILHKAMKRPNMSLNTVVKHIKPKDVKIFFPYQSYEYWTQNLDLGITIDEFLPVLKLLGYHIKEKYMPKNVSIKNRGELSQESIEKIKRLYEKDVKIYEYWTSENNNLHKQ